MTLHFLDLKIGDFCHIMRHSWLQTGDAFTLITSEDTSQVRSIEKVLGYKIEQRKFDNFDYNRSGPPQGQNLKEHMLKAFSKPKNKRKKWKNK